MAVSRIRSLSPRYLGVPSVYLVQFWIYGWIPVSQNRWYSASLLLGSGHRPGKCRAQRSTFNSPRLSISIPEPFWRPASHSDASSRPYLLLILLTLLTHPFTPLPPSPPHALNLPLSTALLSGVAPSRVHPIPVFN